MPRQRKAPPERGPSWSVARGSGLGDHVHGAALLRALGRELDLAVDQREQRVVAAEADARTRVELGAALADDDVAGVDRLPTIDLHAEVFRVGIAAVARGTYALFMCHGCVSLLLVATGNAGDLDFGVVLPVDHLLAMVLAAAERHDAHLVGAAVGLDGGGDGGALERVANLDAVGIAEHEHVVERDLLAGLDVKQLDAQGLALHHAILLAARYQDCVHDQASSVVIVVACLPSRADRSGIVIGSRLSGQSWLNGSLTVAFPVRYPVGSTTSDGSQGTVRCKDSHRRPDRLAAKAARVMIVSYGEPLYVHCLDPGSSRKATTAPGLVPTRAMRPPMLPVSRAPQRPAGARRHHTEYFSPVRRPFSGPHCGRACKFH